MAKAFKPRLGDHASLNLRLIGDVFNAFNANTVLVRGNNIASRA